MRKLFCLATGVLFALVFCQEPEFLVQYRQHLSGKIEELQRQAVAFDARARSQSLTRDQALGHFTTNSDTVISKEGVQIQADFVRLDHLLNYRDMLDSAGPLRRHWVFLRYLDVETAAVTREGFSPGIPMEPKMIPIAAVGFFIGLVVGIAIASAAAVLGRVAFELGRGPDA